MAKRSFLSLVFAIFFANTKLSAAAEIPALCSTPSFSVFTTPKVIQIFQPEGFETFSGKYNNSNSLCVFIVFDDALPANFTLLGTSDFDEPIVLLEVEVTRQRPFLNDAFSNFSVTEDSFISTDENGNIADWLIQTTFRDISLLTQGNSSATVFGEVHLRANGATATTGVWTQTGSIPSIPPPSGFVLFGTGLLSLLRMARRKVH